MENWRELFCDPLHLVDVLSDFFNRNDSLCKSFEQITVNKQNYLRRQVVDIFRLK